MDIQSYTIKAKTYKTRVSSRYLSVDSDSLMTRIAKEEEYYVSKKYDGHFYTLCYENETAVFINPKGNKVPDLEINQVAVDLLKQKGVNQVIFAGELYVHIDGQRTRSFDLSSALANKDVKIRFAAFDVVEIDHEPFKVELNERIEKLEELLPKDARVHHVNNVKIESRTKIEEIFKQIVEVDEEEGIVVRSQGGIYKIKPKFTFDAAVIGFSESDGERKGLFRALLIAMIKPDGSFQIMGHLHHGFNYEERRILLEEMSTEIVASEYIEVARNKTAFHLIKPKRIIEFSCLDVIIEDSKGPVSRMNLKYDEDKGYLIQGKQNSVSFTIPTYVRFRDDKSVNYQDLRFEQLEEVVSFEGIDNINDEDLEDSVIIKREVFSKVSKENLMVKKFVIIQTNKSKTERFSEYVLFVTDFSAGRKDPLKVDLKLSNDLEQIQGLYQKAIDKNIKKGWEQVID